MWRFHSSLQDCGTPKTLTSEDRQEGTPGRDSTGQGSQAKLGREGRGEGTAERGLLTGDPTPQELSRRRGGQSQQEEAEAVAEESKEGLSLVRRCERLLKRPPKAAPTLALEGPHPATTPPHPAVSPAPLALSPHRNSGRRSKAARPPNQGTEADGRPHTAGPATLPFMIQKTVNSDGTNPKPGSKTPRSFRPALAVPGHCGRGGSAEGPAPGLVCLPQSGL